MQGLQRIGGVEFGHIVALDLKGSAGDELFLLYAIADDYDIVERVGLFGKLNGEVVACHLHFLLHKANVGDEKRLTVIGLQGEMSVEIRHSTCLRADDLYRRSRERLAISGRLDRAFHNLGVED